MFKILAVYINKARSLSILPSHRTRSLLQKAKALGNGDNDELRELLDAYPDDLHELQELMHELQANLDSTLHVNENSVREYEEREAEIEALEVQLTSLTEQRGKFREHKEEKEGAWLTPLNEIIQTINTKFSGFFEQLGCAGEVVLDDSPDDYSNYGVEIRVKFREKDTLHKLTAHHQSGGERSVSTILYLMSFQQMANAPFRIVDEVWAGKCVYILAY
ncbi:hypothetical protein SARC_04729 [Sphaeroforma arctica JP610]|uniref:Structural maintenance of chromosomes protein 5 n=1 Tax=Sphaeroforma arctica JP610 TaxID=667725 RepID=A0A0L0G2F4_9EUKA|nr:hypothetical protein SARC_04729 [Sphaeroforma arctica JP610]KNC83006.1 hypothetical protein SARC_04729 [Sphaeroforma arctica JP610]|eukprot:XP_014156908.1 hypothetical protein SARC_04729 [Sphaeroforma arctica JP610]